MKYMHFNSSCAWAGLANLLALRGYDTEDAEIALDMGLPYLIAQEDGAYLAGPMLQGKRWFDLYLLPRGFVVEEKTIPREELSRFLEKQDSAMLGLYVSERDKHAVIYTGMKGGKLSFLNNKWESDPAPGTFSLTAEDLLLRADEPTTVAVLHRCKPQETDFSKLRRDSVRMLGSMRTDLHSFCEQPQDPEAMRGALNRLFRPMFLDGISMMELLGESGIAGNMKTLQSQLMSLLRAGITAAPSEEIDLSLLDRTVEDWADMIRKKDA